VFTDMEDPMNPTAAPIWASPWLRPFNDVAAIDDLLAQVHPTWALGRIKARVRRVIVETPDTRTFVLAPNRNWPGFRAGQHVGVEVEIAGVRHQRRYSLSSAPGARVVAITVKRQAHGKVSSWLHDHLHVGGILTLQPPAGSFTLPDPLPERLLMLSAGSGITPLMAMLRTAGDRSPCNLAFVHIARRPADAIFATELAELAATRPGLTLRHYYSEQTGRFTPAALARLVPDHGERLTLMCGPASFRATVRAHHEARGLAALLHEESFGMPSRAVTCDDAAAREVRCVRSERLFTADGETPLLLAAERGGLRPRYGCRMGICHTCSCVKRSGTVENLLTGEISSEPGERIQLCISRARTDLTLDL
jgi:ferredoxin-NADP reductase